MSSCDADTKAEAVPLSLPLPLPLSQEQFEAMWWTKDPESPYHNGFFIYFTAAWCGPCKKLDQAAIEAAVKERSLPYFKCDETVNKYTSGYCNVRSFPTFHFCRPKKLVSSCSSSDTAEVLAWIESCFQ
jgi:thiol-disulfide isomerase/thioredoxin